MLLVCIQMILWATTNITRPRLEFVFSWPKFRWIVSLLDKQDSEIQNYRITVFWNNMGSLKLLYANCIKDFWTLLKQTRFCFIFTLIFREHSTVYSMSLIKITFNIKKSLLEPMKRYTKANCRFGCPTVGSFLFHCVHTWLFSFLFFESMRFCVHWRTFRTS